MVSNNNFTWNTCDCYVSWSHNICCSKPHSKVEKDFRKMEELKKQAEAADIAKSQVVYFQKHTLAA